MMSNKLYFYKLLLSFFLLNAVASYSQIDTNSILMLEPVDLSITRRVVLENQIPASVSILSKDQIQGMNQSNSLEESLREVPGVFVNNRYNYSQGDRISIRGLGSRAQFGLRSMKVLLDGIPLTFPDGTTQLNNINLSGIGRIEIMRGPSSTLYGNSAAGIILIHTKTPDTSKLVVQPSFTAGSYNFLKSNIEASGSSARSNFHVSVSGTSTHGFREFSYARLYNQNFVFKHFFSERTQLTTIFNFMQAPFMFNPGGLNKKETEAPENVRLALKKMVPSKKIFQGQSGIHLKHDLGKSGIIKTTVYGINRNLYNPIFGRIIEVDRLSAGLRMDYEKQLKLKNSSVDLLAGADLEFQQDNRKEFENNGISEEELNSIHYNKLIQKIRKGDLMLHQKERVKNNGAFTHATYIFRDHFSFSGGIRFDHYNFTFSESTGNKDTRTFSQLSPAAGFTFKINDRLNTYINFSTAFQTPTANEFSNSPDGFRFNKSLKPELVRSLETSIRKRGKKIQSDLSLFYMNITNQLIPYQLSASSDEMYYRNAGSTENKGAEVWFKYINSKLLSLTCSYTYMHYVFKDYELQIQNTYAKLDGKKVPGVPAHRFFSGIRIGKEIGWQMELDVQYTDSYYANDFNGPVSGQSGMKEEFINESYFITNLKLGYTKRGKSLELNSFAGINNLFNIRYNSSIIPNAAGNRFFEPAPGRNFYIGISTPIRVMN